MVPAQNNRLTELLDQVRAEFESQQSRTGEYEQNSMWAISFDQILRPLIPLGPHLPALAPKF